jgi:hypothetical protein
MHMNWEKMVAIAGGSHLFDLVLDGLLFLLVGVARFFELRGWHLAAFVVGEQMRRRTFEHIKRIGHRQPGVLGHRGFHRVLLDRERVASGVKNNHAWDCEVYQVAAAMMAGILGAVQRPQGAAV